MYKKLIFLFLTFNTSLLFGQAGPNVLRFEDFLAQVESQHPSAKQARLLLARGQQELQAARGGFDPVLGSEFSSKTFDHKNYYSLFGAYVKAPTPWGPEVEAGYLYNTGEYLDPEHKTPSSGHAYLGLSLPLLQGLWTNERQAKVEQALLLNRRNGNELKLALNDLLYEAAKAYWEWAHDYYEIELIKQALVLAEQRHGAVRQAFFQGDKPAMDTLEAFLVWQDRQLRLREAQLHFQKSSYLLNGFLWSEGGQPMELQPNSAPPRIEALEIVHLDSLVLEQALLRADSLHPALEWYRLEQARLDWDRRVKANKILPKLDLKYNLLATRNVVFWDDLETATHNYKLGVKFSMPLLLRQPRADLQLSKIKLQENRYKREQKAWELQNKVRSYFNEVEIFAQQHELLQLMVGNYSNLLAAEQEKFRIGESSVFLLNSREVKLLESREKLLSTQIKYLKARSSLSWANASLGIQ